MMETLRCIFLMAFFASCATASCPGSLPSGCICISPKGQENPEEKGYLGFTASLRVFCAGLKLTSIPTGIPPDTEELVLQNNKITTLPKNAFGSQILSKLTTLILSGNGMSSIASDAFLVSGNNSATATPALGTLDLSSNELSTIPEIPCDLMSKLASLEIHNNKFTSAKFPDCYSKCTLLKRITMTSNQGIKSLGKDDLKNLKAKPLRLELGNSISTIDPDAFTHVKPVLSMLGLSENPIGIEGLKNALTALNQSEALSSLHLNSLHGDGLNGSIFTLLESFSAPNLKSVKINSNPVYALTGAFAGDMRSLTGFECESCLIEKVDNVFKSSAITQLNRVMLQRNRLTSVPSALPTTLQYLYLDSNPITQLASNDFQSYTLLFELSLGSTTLKSVAIDAFSALVKLRKLVLANASISESALTSGGSSLFKGLSDLQTLSLSGNAIAQLKDATVFEDLKKLTSFALDAQRTADKLGLTNIDPKVLAPLTALKTLSLSGNAGFGPKQVAGDPKGDLLRPLAQLAKLALDGCGISSVPKDYFSGVAATLTTLSLSENPIPVVLLTDGALAALKKLKTLQLANSSLQYVPRKAFDQWPKLEEVDLRDNPFNCDANLKELYDWLQSVTQNFTAPDAQTAYFGPSATQLLVRGYRSYACASPPPCVNVRLADPAFSTRLAQCTTTPSITTGAPPGPPESPHSSKVWLALLITFLVIALFASVGVTGWWFYSRRRIGYRHIDAPVNI